MKTVCIYNFKGGSFKTTATQTLAAGLALNGKRVLVIDTDPQAHVTHMLGVSPRGGLYDLLVRNEALNNVIEIAPAERYTPAEFQQQAGGYVALIPGNDETALIPMRMTNPLALRSKLGALRDHFDVALIDTSPTPSLMTAVIYLASDTVLYPTKCEALHFDGLKRAIAASEENAPLRERAHLAQIEMLGVVPAIFRKNTLEHSENLDVLKQMYGDKVWRPIPDSIIWAEAARMMQPVFAYAPQTGAAKAAWNMVNEFTKRAAI